MAPSPNIFLLAADDSPNLLPLLRENPVLASSQDEHGYSLMHAAASYNHLDLLRTLVRDFHVDVNVKDEDGETCLFVVETVEAAHVLVEELGIDVKVRSGEDLTAEEKIRGEGDYVTIADYLRTCLWDSSERSPNSAVNINRGELERPPPLPPNITVNVGTMEDAASEAEGEGSVDPDFKRRIEELAARADFQGEEGQQQLRELIAEAVRGANVDAERDVRRRTD
ncbi:hypothetical protein MMC09_001368 [Bachmanniomyces sp. S44760]|nr:hypothetical protein [Bachmanniomyces sp. S44760]